MTSLDSNFKKSLEELKKEVENPPCLPERYKYVSLLEKCKDVLENFSNKETERQTT